MSIPSKQYLNDQLAVAENLYKSNTVTRADYLKTVLCIAYQFALHNHIEDVRVLVSKLDEEYLRAILPEQMASDDYFRDVSHFVAAKLAGAGISEVSDDDLILSMAKIGRA